LDTRVIEWNIPKDGICLEFFGGNSFGLVVVLYSSIFSLEIPLCGEGFIN
jgi:hypothetical protein